jgi:menaquinone-dependent protoporphyrinogen oxidase
MKGKNKMKNRILITYATYAGSTIDVAVAISDTLTERSFMVDVKPIKDNPPLNGYQAVVIGSAVHHAQWLPEAIDYVRTNRTVLYSLPVALFCVHIQNLGDDETSRANRLAYLDGVRSMVHPLDEGFFAGKFDRRGAQRLLPSWVARFVPPIDFRNWNKIHSWADNLSSLLLEENRTQALVKVAC